MEDRPKRQHPDEDKPNSNTGYEERLGGVASRQEEKPSHLQSLDSRFHAYTPFPTEQPMKKRANAARLNNVYQRLKKKLGRRWDEAEDEHRRKSQRKSRQSNSTRWSEDDRILVFQEAANEFLRGTKVWQLVPETTRVVVLDSELSIQQVIDALVSEMQQNCAAPVWNSKTETFSGVATWQCLISALITSGLSLKEFLSKKIGTISLDKMLRINPTHPLNVLIQASMTSESRTFCVVGGTCNGGLETGDILNVFTRQRILRFLFGQLSAHAAGNNNNNPSITSLENNQNQSSLKSSSSTADSDTKARGSAGGAAAIAANNNNKNLFDEILMFTVKQLGIVSRDGVKTVTKGQACLKEVLTGLVKHNLGRVVVVDKEGRAIEMYSRSDIRIMSDEIVSVLDLDVVEAAQKHPRLCTFCSRTDTLQTVMAKMAKGAATAGEVLVCVGPEPHKRYEGLVSFTSLFGILDTKQGGGSVATVQQQASTASSTQGPGTKPNTSSSTDQKKQSAVDMEASMGNGKDANGHSIDDSNNQMQEDSS
eukprot:jgi/Bigna1/84789/estExt_fgenesh1_pg.C_10063